MKCPNCGYENPDDRFCAVCGYNLTGEQAPAQQAPAQQAPAQQAPMQQPAPTPNPKKKKSKAAIGIIIGAEAAVALLLVALIVCLVIKKKNAADDNKTHGKVSTDTADGADSTEADGSDVTGIADTIAYLNRPTILKFSEDGTGTDVAKVPAYTIASDLSNVYNSSKISCFSAAQTDFISTNGFLVTSGYDYEFFEVYEENRYDYTANFVTVDSIMHTYHLYFSYLLKNTERNYLVDDLNNLSVVMLGKAEEQYSALAGTEWEAAAQDNLAFFAVANELLGTGATVPSQVSDLVSQELALINAAEGIADSPLFGAEEDYSQYKPRGYYEGDETLEKYFRAMMWYGRRNFTQNEEELNRAALLMTLALDDDSLEYWESIYTVTSFFAGASDDSGYYEYRPIIDEAYGSDVTVADLIGNEEGWNKFNQLTAELDPPQINSVPVYASDTDEEVEDKTKGFRFMGQRFSIDEAIFSDLIYRNVQENSSDEYRMLPSALDVPAAFGSDTALEILEEQGDTDYKNYSENMEDLRETVASADTDSWSSSLYSGWLYTLSPVLETKGEGYPMFMQSEEWNKKNLVTFLGSYAELKHDTVLYSKQVLAEMGGGDIPVLDDRGYVEPETEVYSRLTQLVDSTSDGLAGYGYLDGSSKDDLAILSDLASQLEVISRKELANETLSDDEYELIRTYGGQLEHFWQAVYEDEADGSYLDSREFPAAVISDVATDPNGSCLELGTGRVNTIYVIAPVDGQLKVTVGAVYSYYEFEQPTSDRLTDNEWRILLGMALNENGEYEYDHDVESPAWTNSFTIDYEWDQ